MNGLLIGRFQPFHLGHIEALRFALSQVDNSISSRIQIYYIPDFENHKKWIENIDSIVPHFGVIFTNDELTQSLYSKRGKKISSVPFRERETLSGTNIREKIISDQNWHDLVPEGTKTVLQKIGAKNRLKIL